MLALFLGEYLLIETADVGRNLVRGNLDRLLHGLSC